ncbi:MAB_1171c family putative transporter [Kineosporia babensis]|uniref:DUF6545 domain-containing protein n=1 Tax=Kineosporia babensis TaxID=499548 RepID=A0A9X1SSF9_9ACTN|nr:MAB_1171c family putative transporter [Kineosporia babensis]MCD5310241.1 hypothetical protein [Kineosporia babensis]
MRVALTVALEIGLWWAAIVKLQHLRRSPGDRPLRAVTGLCFCLALGPLAAMPGLNEVIEEAVPGLSRLLLNLFTVTATYCLMAFYGYSVGGEHTSGQLRRWLAGLIGAQTVMALAWVLAPPPIRIAPAALESLDDRHSVIFTVTALGYMGFGLSHAFRWSVRYARAAHRVRLRTSLRIVSVALACLLTACLSKVGVALTLGLAGDLRPDEEVIAAVSLVYPVLVLLGTALIVTGFCYPAVASWPARVRQARERRGLYRRLGPLWFRMRAAFPHLVLPGGWLPWTDRAYFRRVIEIRDTIVQLGPYYDPELAARVRSAEFGDSSATAEDTREIRVRAVLTVDALRRKQAGQPVESPYVMPALGGDDLDSDARWLAGLAAAVEDAEAQSAAEPVSSSTSSIRST